MRKKPEKWSDFIPVGEVSDEVQLAVHFSGGIFKSKYHIYYISNNTINNNWFSLQWWNRFEYLSVNSFVTFGTNTQRPSLNCEVSTQMCPACYCTSKKDSLLSNSMHDDSFMVPIPYTYRLKVSWRCCFWSRSTHFMCFKCFRFACGSLTIITTMLPSLCWCLRLAYRCQSYKPVRYVYTNLWVQYARWNFTLA